jgi:hypothetical protein
LPSPLPGWQPLPAALQHPLGAVSHGQGPAAERVQPEVAQHRANLMSHWVEHPTSAAAPVEEKGLSHNPDAWYRFTQPTFAMPSSPHDIFHPVRHFDTGHAALNLPLNALYSLSNLAAIPFNAVSNLAALPGEAIHALGGNENDVAAFNFASMMVGVGEVNMATEAIQGMRAASELKTAGQAAENFLVEHEMAAIRTATPNLAELQGSLKLATKRAPRFEVAHSAAGAQLEEQFPEIAHQVGSPANPSQSPILRALQIARGGWPTKVVRFTEKGSRYETLSLGVSSENAARSLAYERYLQRVGEKGSYDFLSNSCTSTARDILKAGGLQPAFWARSPELLKVWFKMQGGK